ncbi:uncharacterized protein JN550_012889 [Neoarthrinium moseri]|uniref:uncharacterized protein n=1 Tax=Neoarthrinium moseri TaxID=1658444 RepID=UPI001FDB43CD|nr:uncharacterized protein JN550_012889 [Neoarthrinium moseri]KAI1858067.1 hypothetical protein JN550_012889 [Neoarthrinium moseri]
MGVVIQTTVTVTEFIRDCREARADLISVNRGLSDLKIVLELLKADTEDDAGNPLFSESLRTQILTVIENCGDVTAKIEQVLVDMRRRRAGPIKWALEGKKEVASLKNSLEAHRGELHLALEMVNLSISKATKEDTGDTIQILDEIAKLEEKLSATDRDFVLQGYLDSLTTYAATVYDDLPDENADRSDSNTERGDNISFTEKQTEHLDSMMGKNVSPHVYTAAVQGGGNVVKRRPLPAKIAPLVSSYQYLPLRDQVQHTLSQRSLDQIHSDRGQKSNSPLSIDPQSDTSADTAVDGPPTKVENGREAIAIVDSQVSGLTQGKLDPATSSQVMRKISQGNVSGKRSSKSADLGMIDLRVTDFLSNINIQVRHLTFIPRILDDIYTFGVSENGEHVATLQTDRRICVWNAKFAGANASSFQRKRSGMTKPIGVQVVYRSNRSERWHQ